jgi:putative chitinase
MTDWKAIIQATVPPTRRAHVKPEIVAMIAERADELFARYGFTTIRRQASIVGHMAVESTYFSTLHENLNYRTAGALMRAWPKRFPSEASCVGFLGNPIALANKVYNGRMGNRAGTNDGYDNRGTGLLQQTGADNMEALAKKMGVSVEEIRKRLIAAEYALECACVSYLMHVSFRTTDAGDIDRETKGINGGYNGLAERKAAIAAATRALAAQRRAQAIRGHLEEGAAATSGAPSEVSLAAAGSRIIKGANAARNDLILKGVTVATGAGVVADEGSQQPEPATLQDHIAQAAETADTLRGTVETAGQATMSAQAALEWAQAHWHTLALAALAAIFVALFVHNYLALRRLKRARVEDETLGLSIGRL